MIHRALAATGAAVLLAACSAGSDGPLDVAGAFWLAARAGDSDSVRGLASAGTVTGLVQGGHARFEDLVLTDARIRDDVAIVQTAMTLRNADGATLRIRFPTHLVREKGTWKVALDETMTAAAWSAHGAAMTDSTGGSDSLVARDTLQ